MDHRTNDSMPAIKAIIMAAGKGTRLQSEKHDLPKVLREAAGQPLLAWVLKNIAFIDPDDITIVIGYKGEKVEERFGDRYGYAWQREQLGTGHAVQQAVPSLEGYDGPVLVCSGDMPLVQASSYRGLLETHLKEKNACTILAFVSDKDMHFGRIVRAEDGSFLTVVEDKDCTPEQKKITELNCGVYIFDAKLLVEGLSQLKNNNAQSEYYLTDVPAWIQKKGGRIGISRTTGEYEGFGVNTQEDLDFVSDILSKG